MQGRRCYTCLKYEENMEYRNTKGQECSRCDYTTCELQITMYREVCKDNCKVKIMNTALQCPLDIQTSLRRQGRGCYRQRGRYNKAKKEQQRPRYIAIRLFVFIITGYSGRYWLLIST